MMNRSPDKHEAAMARADLYKLANYSMKLFKMIHEGQELEGWVQAKITKAADYVSSVYHFMQYEMKTSDYGSKLENSDVYSESVRRAFEQKLMEAKKQAEKIKKDAEKMDEGFDDMEKYLKSKKGPQPSGGEGKKSGSRYGGSKQAADKDDEEDEGKKKDKKVKESAKPDYLDFDKDGNKKEPMKKALKDKKIKEGGYYDPANDLPVKGSQASMDRANSAMATLANTNPALAKKYPPGSLTDDKAKQLWLNAIAAGQIPSNSKFIPSNWGGGAPATPGISVKEDSKLSELKKSTLGSYVKKASKDAVKKTRQSDAEDEYGDPDEGDKLDKKAQKRMAGVNKAVDKLTKEAAMSPAPVPNKTGIPNTAKTTVPGMRATQQDLKKANSSAALGEGKCNHTPKGKKCPVHGLKECGSMYEAKNLKQQAAIAIAKKKAK